MCLKRGSWVSSVVCLKQASIRSEGAPFSEPLGLISLIQNLWVLLLYIIYCAIGCNSSQDIKQLFQQSESTVRVITTNYSSSLDRIFINDNSYYDFVCNSQLFVDNSMLLNYIAKERNVAIVLPRRFGKSLNLYMVKCFFEIEVRQINHVWERVPRNETKAYQIFETGSLTSCRHGDGVVKLNSKFGISSYFKEKHMNKYPVIFITFQKMKAEHASLCDVYILLMKFPMPILTIFTWAIGNIKTLMIITPNWLWHISIRILKS